MAHDWWCVLFLAAAGSNNLFIKILFSCEVWGTQVSHCLVTHSSPSCVQAQVGQIRWSDCVCLTWQKSSSTMRLPAVPHLMFTVRKTSSKQTNLNGLGKWIIGLGPRCKAQLSAWTVSIWNNSRLWRWNDSRPSGFERRRPVSAQSDQSR